MIQLLTLLVGLSGPLARVLNLFLDAIEKNPTANAEWQKLRERVFFNYGAPANAAKAANEIEAQLDERVRIGTFGES